MMRHAMMILLLLLAGCAAPQIDATGTVTCASWSSLTARATTVYLHAEQPGTVVVQPDCTVAVTVAPAAVAGK